MHHLDTEKGLDVTRLLIQNGADVNARDKFGQTLLFSVFVTQGWRAYLWELGLTFI